MKKVFYFLIAFSLSSCTVYRHMDVVKGNNNKEVIDFNTYGDFEVFQDSQEVEILGFVSVEYTLKQFRFTTLKAALKRQQEINGVLKRENGKFMVTEPFNYQKIFNDFYLKSKSVIGFHGVYGLTLKRGGTHTIQLHGFPARLKQPVGAGKPHASR